MISNRLLRLDSANTSSEISLKDPAKSAVSSDNLLAYYPKFADRHHSGLAGIFINVEGIFPCIAKLHEETLLKGPSCKLFTSEEDGFRDGKAVIELGDAGNGELKEVFGSEVILYGLAISGCPTLTAECLPQYYQNEIMCMFPRSICP